MIQTDILYRMRRVKPTAARGRAEPSPSKKDDLLKVGSSSGGDQYIKAIQYNKDDQRTSITYGNGVTTTYTYNSAKKSIQSLITRKADNTTQQHLSYGFDKAGNISAITNALQGGRTVYSYDTLNRMTAATASGFTNTALNFDSSYSFNRNGGLLSRPDVSSYTYNTGTHRLSTAGRFTLSYDANGNVTQRTETVGSDPQPMLLHYNCRNVLSDITNAHSGDGGGVWVRFAYDSSGQRLRKYSSLGNDFRYINGYYAEKRYDTDAVRITNQHIYAGKERVCTLVNGSAHFIHRDQINSGGLITTNGGSVADRVAFAPYGTMIYQQNSGVTNGIEEKFTGQILDEETGLYYYNARYYDPTIGVFLAADSIVPDAYSSQSLNRYMYVVGNPVVYNDPTGHANTTETLANGWSMPPSHFMYNTQSWMQDFFLLNFIPFNGSQSGSINSAAYTSYGGAGMGYSANGTAIYSANKKFQENANWIGQNILHFPMVNLFNASLDFLFHGKNDGEYTKSYFRFSLRSNMPEVTEKFGLKSFYSFNMWTFTYDARWPHIKKGTTSNLYLLDYTSNYNFATGTYYGGFGIGTTQFKISPSLLHSAIISLGCIVPQKRALDNIYSRILSNKYQQDVYYSASFTRFYLNMRSALQTIYVTPIQKGLDWQQGGSFPTFPVGTISF